MLLLLVDQEMAWLAETSCSGDYHTGRVEGVSFSGNEQKSTPYRVISPLPRYKLLFPINGSSPFCHRYKSFCLLWRKFPKYTFPKKVPRFSRKMTPGVSSRN